MTSIALGIFIIFVVYIAIWSIRNDTVRSISDQTGLIRMRRPSEPGPRPGSGGGRRRPEAAERAGGSPPSRVHPDASTRGR